MNIPADNLRHAHARLNRLLAIGYLTLLLVTWRLWIPQTAFPRVPLVSQVNSLTPIMELGLLALLLYALTEMLFATDPAIRRDASRWTILSTAGLVLFDQHRLQPWVWQFLIVAVVLALADHITTRRLWQWLVIGIYGWSAWSKIDYGFCLQHGPFLLDGLLKSVGLTSGTRLWPESIRFTAAAAIPLFEALVAAGLCWQRTRTFALAGATVMHAGLLMSLGPLGHHHRPAVLIWNAFFLIQNWHLFRPEPVESVPATHHEEDIPADVVDDTSLSVPAWRLGNGFAAIAVMAALSWPLLEPLGLCDHWPAWAVYAAAPERVTVYVNSSETPQLSDALRRYLIPQEIPGDWVPIRIDRWSLDSVFVPLYPQDRFQVGVALGLAHDFKLTTLRFVIEGPANRWTGQRTTHEYQGLESIESLAHSFRCNAIPRTQTGPRR